MALQLGLFGLGPREFVDDASGRIAYHPAVYDAGESGALFTALHDGLTWARESMWMYDHTVTVPRLIARFEPGTPLPAPLLEAKERVEALLGTAFNGVSVQCYRDGRDSVAWHSDHTEELIPRAIVALLSLGAVREIHVRTKARPRRQFAVPLEPGSLFVMGGEAQTYWEHHIPKVVEPIAPRISVAFRQHA